MKICFRKFKIVYEWHYMSLQKFSKNSKIVKKELLTIDLISFPVQDLIDNYKPNDYNFFQQMFQRLDENPDIFKYIIWTDESSFSTTEVFNRRNKHSWENKNQRQRKVVQIKKSGRKLVKVWCGIFENNIVGPIFFYYNLTEEIYLQCILLEMALLLEQHYCVEELEGIIWQQDGAPPHNILEVREHSNGQFDIWIGKNSPDLIPLDTFL